MASLRKRCHLAKTGGIMSGNTKPCVASRVYKQNTSNPMGAVAHLVGFPFTVLHSSSSGWLPFCKRSGWHIPLDGFLSGSGWFIPLDGFA